MRFALPFQESVRQPPPSPAPPPLPPLPPARGAQSHWLQSARSWLVGRPEDGFGTAPNHNNNHARNGAEHAIIVTSGVVATALVICVMICLWIFYRSCCAPAPSARHDGGRRSRHGLDRGSRVQATAASSSNGAYGRLPRSAPEEEEEEEEEQKEEEGEGDGEGELDAHASPLHADHHPGGARMQDSWDEIDKEDHADPGIKEDDLVGRTVLPTRPRFVYHA
jgi:hypothetical protein